jgi:hypothetical protein
MKKSFLKNVKEEIILQREAKLEFVFILSTLMRDVDACLDVIKSDHNEEELTDLLNQMLDLKDKNENQNDPEILDMIDKILKTMGLKE